jgi:hypothetical protein
VPEAGYIVVETTPDALELEVSFKNRFSTLFPCGDYLIFVRDLKTKLCGCNLGLLQYVADKTIILCFL